MSTETIDSQQVRSKNKLIYMYWNKNVSHLFRGYNKKNIGNGLYLDDICIGWLKSEGMTFA